MSIKVSHRKTDVVFPFPFQYLWLTNEHDKRRHGFSSLGQYTEGVKIILKREGIDIFRKIMPTVGGRDKQVERR